MLHSGIYLINQSMLHRKQGSGFQAKHITHSRGQIVGGMFYGPLYVYYTQLL